MRLVTPRKCFSWCAQCVDRAMRLQVSRDGHRGIRYRDVLLLSEELYQNVFPLFSTFLIRIYLQFPAGYLLWTSCLLLLFPFSMLPHLYTAHCTARHNSVCQVLLLLKGHSTSGNKWCFLHRAALQQQCLCTVWEKSWLDFPLTGSVTSCFRFRVTIVPWWDIFSRPHWYKLHLLLPISFFSLFPFILCYKISGIVTILYSHYSTLAFSQPEIQSIQTTLVT